MECPFSMWAPEPAGRVVPRLCPEAPKQQAAKKKKATVTDWMMRWDLARNGLWHASHASCRAGQADAVRGSEDDRVDAAYADVVRISAALPYLQYRIWSGNASHAAGQVKSVEDDPSRCC